jgi:hypothetical protein
MMIDNGTLIPPSLFYQGLLCITNHDPIAFGARHFAQKPSYDISMSMIVAQKVKQIIVGPLSNSQHNKTIHTFDLLVTF